MIRRARFKNFKSLRDLGFDLSRFTIIVGANGSGKTSLLDGLRYAAQSAFRGAETLFVTPFTPQNLWSRGATEPMRLEIWGDSNDQRFRVALNVEVDPEATEGLGWKATREGELDDQPVDATPPLQEGPNRARNLFTRMRLSGAVGSTLKLRLDAQKIAEPSYSEEDVGFDPSGAGLASRLAGIALSQPDLFQTIQEMARAIVPRLERIRFASVKMRVIDSQTIRVDASPAVQVPVERTVKGEQLVLDFAGAPSIPAQLASEGTLLAIALATALFDASGRRLLLLDDIDQSLHPTAQRSLVDVLRKMQAIEPDLQIVATSHSPYFLDCFAPEEMLVTASRGDGSTACARLSDHPDIARWKDVAKSGEIWSFVGEDWVTGERSGERA